jgi:excisionase family DNA binding protein
MAMRLLKANDVAEILACSLSQIYAMKATGCLPYVKIQGMVRFREEDIEEFVNSRVVIPPGSHKRTPRHTQLKHLRL